MLCKHPAYALTAIILLGLGLGSNAALFAIAQSVLLRPLPYANPEQLVVTLHNGDVPVSPADFLDYRRDARSFEDLGAAQVWGGTVRFQDQPEQVPGLQVTANMMRLLGVAPAIGRSFTSAEEHGGAAKVLLLSHRLWRDRFGSDRNIAGRTILVDRLQYTVIGVMPPAFRFAPFWATRAQMWAPLDLDARVNDRGGRSLRVFGRLKRGVSAEAAQAEMTVLARRLADRYPATNAKLGISVIALHEKVVHSVRPTLLVLLGTVGFILLIACATVSNLVLASAASRRKEWALRRALGAERADLIRMVLVEVALLASLGGVTGLTFGSWAIQGVAAALPPDSIPRLSELRFDWPSILFAGFATLMTVVVAGLAPAIQAARTPLNDDLKTGSRGSSGGASHARLRTGLIAVEVALSLVLLAGAGLMMRTMLALHTVQAGFNPQHLLTLQVALSGTRYDANGMRSPVFRQLGDVLQGVGGVESASAINHLPLGGDIWRLDYRIDGRPKPADGEQAGAVYRVIMPAYFRTMQIGLLQGRAFNDGDGQNGNPVAIINEAMAKRQWPGESALGKHLRFGTEAADQRSAKTIVGVVRDARQNDWTSPALDEIYLPYYQRPDSMGLSYLTFVLRTRSEPGEMVEKVRSAIRQLEPGLPISEIATMEHIIQDELWRQRLASTLMGAFAALAVLLAAIGIFGVVSRSMRERSREIGIRVALGARPQALVGLAMREGMLPVAAGIAVGLLFSLWLTRFLESLLYGVAPADASTLIAVVVGLAAVCGLANFLPAFRASRADPLLALRNE